MTFTYRPIPPNGRSSSDSSSGDREIVAYFPNQHQAQRAAEKIQDDIVRCALGSLDVLGSPAHSWHYCAYA